MTNYKEVFGRIIHEQRIKLGLTQEDLARKTGTTKVSISRYERGECLPRITRYLSLLRALEFTSDQQEAIFKGTFGQQTPQISKTIPESIDDVF